MTITPVKEQGCTILALSGRMDATTACDFDICAKEYVEADTSALLIDMQDLEYISSAGLRSFLNLAKKAKAKQIKLGFCSLKPMVFEVFHISGFDRMLSLYDTRTAGLTAFA